MPERTGGNSDYASLTFTVSLAVPTEVREYYRSILFHSSCFCHILLLKSVIILWLYLLIQQLLSRYKAIFGILFLGNSTQNESIP